MTHPDFKTVTVRRTSYDLIDTFRKEVTPIPSRAEVIAWLTEYAVKNKRDFLRFVKERQAEED